MGTMYATCAVASIAVIAASAATTVFPDPTSPCSRRFMGRSPARSARISESTRSCPWVSLYGSFCRKLRSRAPVPTSGSAAPGSARCCLTRERGAASRTRRTRDGGERPRLLRRSPGSALARTLAAASRGDIAPASTAGAGRPTGLRPLRERSGPRRGSASA